MKKSVQYILTFFIGISALISVALLWEKNLILSITLIILSALMLLLKKSKREIETFIVCAIAGGVAESFAIVFGVWQYGNPNLFNIPFWLIPLWGIAAIFIVRVYLHFRK